MRHHKGEYMLTYPSRVDSSGNHLTYHFQNSHKKRAATVQQDSRMYFKVAAFGQKFFLNVSENRDFTSRHLVVEYMGNNGSVTDFRRPAIQSCYYTGQLVDKDGWIALSTCQGLVSI